MTERHQPQRPSRILFGSCNSQHLEQPLWPAITARNAQAFVWGGDAVYGDVKNVMAATPSKLAADYAWLLNSEPYRRFLQSNDNITVIGTLDDHDFGTDNGDRTYPHKRESATLFVDFLERSNRHNKHNLSLVRQRAETGQGVYGVTVFDFAAPEDGHVLLSDEEAGLDPEVPPRETPLSDRSVAIFTLDVRSNKDPWNQHGPRQTDDYRGDFLGDKQWVWLEEGLRRSTAAVNIVVSGLQVHVDRFVDGSVAEEWSRFPTAQHRLYQALLQPNVQAPFIISGDVHMGEFLRRDCQRMDAALEGSVVRRPLMELTTSGMSHSWGTRFCSRPTEQWTPHCHSSYLQGVLKYAMHWAHWNAAWKNVLYDDVTQEFQYTLDNNFGEFEFDWESRSLTVRLLGKDGVELRTQAWTLDALSGKEAWGRRLLRDDHFDEAAQRSANYSGGNATMNDYYCLPYRGPQTASQKYFCIVTSFTFIGLGSLLPILLPFVVAWRCLFSSRQKIKKKKE